MKIQLLVSIVFLFTLSSTTAQLKLKVETDKQNYLSDEQIIVKCIVTNQSKDTIKQTVDSFNSCQAGFYLDNFYSRMYEIVLPASQDLIYPPNYSRTYTWIFKPWQFGVPSFTGKHRLVGTYLKLTPDTTYINAERANSFSFSVSFLPQHDSAMSVLKQNLKVILLNKSSFLDRIVEKWQLMNVNYDSVFSELKLDKRFSNLSYSYSLNYSSVTLTKIAHESELTATFQLSQNYPNPFNPSTTINYTIPVETRHGKSLQRVILKVYDILGREIATLVDEFKQPGSYNAQLIMDNSQFTSGVYFYTLRAGNYVQTKKMLLIK